MENLKEKETSILNLHVAADSCDFRADLTDKTVVEGSVGLKKQVILILRNKM